MLNPSKEEATSNPLHSFIALAISVKDSSVDSLPMTVIMVISSAMTSTSISGISPLISVPSAEEILHLQRQASPPLHRSGNLFLLHLSLYPGRLYKRRQHPLSKQPHPQKDNLQVKWQWYHFRLYPLL